MLPQHCTSDCNVHSFQYPQPHGGAVERSLSACITGEEDIAEEEEDEEGYNDEIDLVMVSA